MPHISVKMLAGRTEEQKQKAVKALCEALEKTLGVPSKYISVTVEDYTAQEWQKVFKQEITDKKDKVYQKPQYKPEDLL